MLNFVVPLRSPQSSKDWDRVSRLCIRTLRSLCQQSCEDYRVFLVCNEPPLYLVEHPKVTVVQDKFPLPTAERTTQMADKALKVRRGLLEVGEAGGGFVMSADSDDLVSRSLAAIAAANPRANGWCIRVGYTYNEGSPWLEKHFDFNYRCGTSHIIRVTPEDLPRGMEGNGQDSFLLAHGHHMLADALQKAGRPLEPLPFPGAIYVKDTGENYTGDTLRRIGVRARISRLWRTRPLTPQKRREFGIGPF